MRLQWSRKALNNRLAICRYIGDDSPDAAKRMDTLFVEAARSLLIFPFKGKCGRVTGTRELIAHTNYILIYTIDGDIIRILSILHGARQYPQE